MAYTVTNALADGTKINAAELNQDFNEARRWFHTLTNADISSDVIDTEQIVKPDVIYESRGNGNTAITVRFASGLFIGIQTDGGSGYDNDVNTHTQFFTCHVKGENPTASAKFIDIPNACSTFYLQHKANVVVRAYGWADADKNAVISDSGHANLFYIFVDGTREVETISYNASSAGTSTAGSPAYNGIEKNRSIPVNTMWSGNLSKGSHTIKLVVDPRLELGWIEHITFTIDAIYIDNT